MSGFRLISSIKRGLWLIDESWVYDNMPLIDRVLAGEPVSEFSAHVTENTGQVSNSFVSYDPRFGWDHAPENSTAIHSIIGPVFHHGMCGPGTSHFHAQFKSADSHPNITGHLFVLDTPGGEASGIKEFSQAIKASTKRKIGYIDGGMSASAGVWLMSGLDEVYASSDLVSVGSVGAYYTLLDFSEKEKKDGIRRTVIRAKQSSDKNLIYDRANAGDKAALAKLEEEVSFLAGQFISWVQECRGDRLTTDDWQTGKMYRATEAVAIGLIDGIKSLDEVSALFSQKTQIKNMSKFNNVAALSGKDQVTQEDLDLANADLTAEGITHVTLVEQSVIDEAARVTTELETANAQIEKANATIADHTATIQTQAERIKTLESVIANRAHEDNGAAVSQSSSNNSEIEDQPEQKVAAHNRIADQGVFR